MILSDSSDRSWSVSALIVMSPEVDVNFLWIWGETAATLAVVDMEVSEPLRNMEDELLCVCLYSAAILARCAESDGDSRRETEEYEVELEEEDRREVIAGFETEADLSSLKTMLYG